MTKSEAVRKYYKADPTLADSPTKFAQKLKNDNPEGLFDDSSVLQIKNLISALKKAKTLDKEPIADLDVKIEDDTKWEVSGDQYPLTC
jgi:hypothetical protein